MMTSAARDEDIARTSKLLHDVFGADRFSTPEYLQWLYSRAPEGDEIAENLDENGHRVAHYCVVPQTWHSRSSVLQAALSLNTAVAQQAQGRGLFTKLAEQTYHQAHATRDVQAVVGVANANSTPGFAGRLKFRLVMPLPVRMGLRPLVRARAVNSYVVTKEFLSSPTFSAVASSIDYRPGPHWSQRWTPEKLAWRLSSPIGRYSVHANEDGVLVTTEQRLGWLRVAVILKSFLTSDNLHSTPAALIAAACRFHRTLLFLHVGVRSSQGVGGIPVPRRLLPSPLNLIYRPLHESAPPREDFTVGDFEFLDFDAY